MLFRSVRSGSSGTNCFSKWKLTLGEARELPRRGGGVGGVGKGCRKSDLNTLFKRFIRWTGYTLRILSRTYILDIPPDTFSRDE